MQAHYRADYPGEFVVLETRWSGGSKQQQREFVANPIENHHISGRAACIGSATDSHKFDYRILERHRGGLLSSKKLQNYGTGQIAGHMRLDFVVETNAEQLAQLVQKDYHVNNIVYTTARHCVNNQGLFYLIPLNPRLLDLVTIVYLAAFDGHKEIFLLGYHNETPVDKQDWHLQLRQIFNTYSGTMFYIVGESTNFYQEWLDCANVKALTYRDFIGYCDV